MASNEILGLFELAGPKVAETVDIAVSFVHCFIDRNIFLNAENCNLNSTNA